MNLWKCSGCGRQERQNTMPPMCNSRDECGMTWHLIEKAKPKPRPQKPPNGSKPSGQQDSGNGSCGLALIVIIVIAILWGLSASGEDSNPAPEKDEASLMARRLLAKQLAEERGESGPETASMQAREWLAKNGGIAIIVGDGTHDDATPDELGKKVVQRFWDGYKVKAAYFVRTSTAEVNTLTFENRYFPLGRGLIDKNGKKTGIYTPTMWQTKEKADALIAEIYDFHIAGLEIQVRKEKVSD